MPFLSTPPTDVNEVENNNQDDDHEDVIFVGDVPTVTEDDVPLSRRSSRRKKAPAKSNNSYTKPASSRLSLAKQRKPDMTPTIADNKITKPLDLPRKDRAFVLKEALFVCKGLNSEMAQRVIQDLVEIESPVTSDDIAGLAHAKNVLWEMIVLPMKNPEIFRGLRSPVRGALLFGPPGTGKTMIGKWLASEARCNFFSVSASTLASKWMGESEQMARTLFQVARAVQPSIIFIDEIDSLLTQRSDNENEGCRRLKTELLIQMEGCNTAKEENNVVVIGATNLPGELDEAARRRLQKRLYIPLPDAAAKKALIKRLISSEENTLSDSDIDTIVNKMDGYSGADTHNICKEAAMGPLREIKEICGYLIDASEMRPIALSDFLNALDTVKPSVCKKDLKKYEEWNKDFGC